MTNSVNGSNKKNVRRIFIPIVMALILIIAGLAMGFLYMKSHGSNQGMMTFNLNPSPSQTMIYIDDHDPLTFDGGTFQIDKLSTANATRYRIVVAGYEDYIGSSLAQSEGKLLDINLTPKQPVVQNRLKIFVSNDNALVTVDGEVLTGNHNFQKDNLSTGEHRIHVSKPGYKSIDENIYINKAGEKSKTFDLKPAFATLVIKTNPHQAKFELRNLTSGTNISGDADLSGKRIDNLPVDDQYVIVIHDGSETIEHRWKPEVRSTPEEAQVKIFEIKHDPNSVAAAAPTAHVSPSNASSKPRAPKPSASKDSAPKAETAKVDKPAPTGDSPGILQIIGKPPCDIVIDGKASGSTPKKLEKPAGNYTIQCGSKEKRVTLSPGAVEKVLF